MKKKMIAAVLTIAMCVLPVLPVHAQETKVIGFAAPYANHQAWQIIKEGALEAGEYFSNDDVKYEVIWTGPSNMGDTAGMLDVMDTFIADQVDAIAFCPEVESAYVNITQKIKDLGIPTFTFAADMASDPTLRTSYVGTSNYEVGRQQIEGLHKALGTDDLKVCILMSSLEAANQRTQVEAITDYCKELSDNGADAEVLEVRDDKGAQDATYTYDTLAGMLLAYPECNVLLSTHGNAGVLLAKAIKETGNEGKVVSSSYDESDDDLDCIRNGENYSLMCQNMHGWGYGCVAAAVRCLEGLEMEDFYNAGCVEVTLDNIDAYSEDFAKLSYAFNDIVE